jgi:hypothetical protein
MISSLIPVSIQNCARMGRKVHSELIRTSLRILSRTTDEPRLSMYESCYIHTLEVCKKVMLGHEWETSRLIRRYLSLTTLAL